jgi:predicted TIM-barrel fold metal-dependent hydrolase
MTKINRRKFFKDTALSAAGIMVGGSLMQYSFKEDSTSSSDISEVLKYKKIDSHAHVWSLDNGDPDLQIDYADRLGIDKLLISNPITRGEATPKRFRENNDLILKAVAKYPDRFIGQMTLNPTYGKESLEEIDRCVDNGMVGLKVYKQLKINDPLYYPIIEKFIDLNMIILMHSGPGETRIGPKYDRLDPPTLSIPEDFVDVARRYPEAMFQFAHLGGGLDWEYACKALKDSPNVYVDTSGSNNDENIINFGLKYIGEDRLVFGCDRSYYQSVGNMMASNLSEVQRKKIFFENYNNILKKAGRNVN